VTFSHVLGQVVIVFGIAEMPACFSLAIKDPDGNQLVPHLRKDATFG